MICRLMGPFWGLKWRVGNGEVEVGGARRGAARGRCDLLIEDKEMRKTIARNLLTQNQ